MNRSRIITPVICLILLSVSIGCAATQKTESTGQYVDDSVITAKVQAAILAEPSLKIFQIDVVTYKGVVLLSGFVDSEQKVKKAEKVARGIAGVAQVRNELVVK